MKNKIIGTAKAAFLSIALFIVVFPLLFIFVSTFKTEQQIFTAPWALPETLDFVNYTLMFTKYNMHIYYINSIFYSVFGCVISVGVTSMAAYYIHRMKWRLSKLAFGFLMSGLMIPVHALIVPMYITISRLGIPRHTALLMLYVATTLPTTIFIISGYLHSIPISIEESAVIDGCSIPQVFVNIIVPLIKPVIATTVILNFLSIWKDLLLALIFLNEDKEQTIQLGMMLFMDKFFSNYALLLTSVILGILPSIIVYLFMSDKIISGMATGAVKG